MHNPFKCLIWKESSEFFLSHSAFWMIDITEYNWLLFISDENLHFRQLLSPKKVWLCMSFLVACVVWIDHHSNQLIWKTESIDKEVMNTWLLRKQILVIAVYLHDQFELWVSIGKNISTHMVMFSPLWTSHLQKISFDWDGNIL